MRTRVPAIALAMLLATAACGEVQIDATRQEPVVVQPVGDGTWREIPEAPIGTRPYSISGWSGSEALFWAGSSLTRNFANTRGAAYDPATDSWRELPTPGWGHPGLTGTLFDGQFYVAAKGGGSRIDPSDGRATDLPPVKGFVLATVVATDEAIWGLGPTNWSPEGPVEIGIARYDTSRDEWLPGPAFEAGPEMGQLFQDILFVEQPVLWTGSEIVVWSNRGHGAAFDPSTESWQELPALLPPQAEMVDSEVAVGGSGLVVLAKVDQNGTTGYGIASWDREAWAWQETEMELDDFETVTITVVGDWMLVFSPDLPPYLIHMPTGSATMQNDAPIAGVQAPNVVWTGEELVIWGGAPTRSDDNPNPAGGAIWIPPGG